MSKVAILYRGKEYIKWTIIAYICAFITNYKFVLNKIIEVVEECIVLVLAITVNTMNFSTIITYHWGKIK